ncbi:MAG: hypothetical protein J7L14_02455 [Candidatus Diapherotrites archaeon]|nr:hypothetical protein [Candidatus Diapherotrites archaeon]
MPNITLYVPEEIHKKMKKYKELKWSKIVRDAIENTLKKLEEAELRYYALKRLAKEGEDAKELFEF